MKILLVDDEQDILEVLMFTLDSQVEADLITANSGNEAIDVIKEEKELDLIICDYNMNNGTGGDVYRYLLDHNIGIPYVMCSSDSPEDHNVFEDRRFFIGNILKPGVFDGVESILTRYEKYCEDVSLNKEVARTSSEYTEITFNLLKSFQILPGDIFIRVSDEKILKIFSKFSELTKEDINKYKQKEMNHFLVLNSEVKLFVDTICNKIDSILKRKTNATQEENLLDVHSVILETVHSIGISAQIIRATEKSVEYALDLFKQNREFKSFSKKIFGHKGEFLTKHSIALAYISCGILSKLSWDSFENRNKLVLASFYHDIAIKDFKVNECFNLENLKQDDSFYNHPIYAADLIKRFKQFPADVDKIILEHHEHPQGKGFPKKIAAGQISPLGTIFNVAHRIVECMFKSENVEMITKEAIVECLAKDMSFSGSFKKVIDAFKQTSLFQ